MVNDIPGEFRDSTLAAIYEENLPQPVVKEGIVSQHEQTIRVLRDENAIAIVKLGEPVLVSMADQEEPWGYYQFPDIYRSENGHLIVNWQMKKDSHTTYGYYSNGRRMSVDEGNTWIDLDEDYFKQEGFRVLLSNGDVLKIETPASVDISQYQDFPERINSETIASHDFYKHSELPDELQGNYFTLYNLKEHSSYSFHAKINDPNLLRYAINGLMPIHCWGDMKEFPNGDLVIGAYPTYEVKDGNVYGTSVTFYESKDCGNIWNVLGRIPYQKNGKKLVYDGSEGFNEPTWEVLKDGTYICVIRTGGESPMLISTSKDRGITWTEPKPIAPNGVSPRLLTLENGTIVLTSGRPGVQVRFSLDGEGLRWTEPIDMLPFMGEDGNYNIYANSCGYTSLLKAGDNSFYMVYSDFQKKNSAGQDRKAIVFRKIEVINANGKDKRP